jgi:hypothetical protein
MAQNGEAETVRSGALAHDSRGRESSETGALESPTNGANRAPEAKRLDAREAVNARVRSGSESIGTGGRP